MKVKLIWDCFLFVLIIFFLCIRYTSLMVIAVSAVWLTYIAKESLMCLCDAGVGIHVLEMEEGGHWRVTVFV